MYKEERRTTVTSFLFGGQRIDFRSRRLESRKRLSEASHKRKHRTSKQSLPRPTCLPPYSSTATHESPLYGVEHCHNGVGQGVPTRSLQRELSQWPHSEPVVIETQRSRFLELVFRHRPDLQGREWLESANERTVHALTFLLSPPSSASWRRAQL